MPDWTSGLLAITALLIANSLLSAARAAFVNASRPRLRQMAESNAAGAALAVRVAEDATPLLVTLRLCQTFCRFGVAGLAALLFTPSLGSVFRLWSPLGEQAEAVALFVMLLIFTMVVVSLGEFLPETLAMRSPEQAAIWFAPVIRALEWLLDPLVRLTLWLSMRIGTPMAGQRVPMVTEEEIKTMVDAGEEGGAIEEDEKDMIYSIFDISDTWAREIMVPRIDVLALDAETPVQAAIDAMLNAGHSRAPVYQGTIDNVLGILYAKDLLRLTRTPNPPQRLRELLRPAYFIPETKKVNELLAELQAKRIHMAVVVDEYGGTAGIVTLEDIVEEIVGDIRDEYDINEEAEVERLSETEYVFDARIDLDDVNEQLGLHLPTEESDSLGGFIYGELGHVPVVGEKVTAQGVDFEVLIVAGRRIRKVRAVRLPPPPAPEPRRTGPLAALSERSDDE